MEAPEKIYLYPNEADWGIIPWGEGGVEYIRTDAFIEKTWNWIENNLLSSNQQDKSLLYYEQFKKYMNGE